MEHDTEMGRLTKKIIENFDTSIAINTALINPMIFISFY